MTTTFQPSPPQVAQPKGYPMIGHALDYRLNPLSFYRQCAQYGDFVRLQFGPHPVYFLNHPDLIKAVFVTQGSSFMARAEGRESRFFDPLFGHGLAVSEGAFWRRQRRLMQPIFQRSHLADYGDTAVAQMQAQLDTWRTGDVADIRPKMTQVSRQIVGKIAFGDVGLAHLDSLETVLNAALQEYNNRDRNWLLYLMPEHFPTPANRRYHAAAEAMDRWIYAAIAAGRHHNPDTGDMLCQLLKVQDETGQGMSDRELRDELVNVVVGHDTIADVFCWAWWQIAHYPDWEARLVEEWQTVLGGRSPNMADIPHLPCTEWTVKEVLRLYPLAWVTGRVTTQDCEIAGQPIYTGENVVMCQWVTHRDSRFFDHPNRFYPERWASDAAKRIPSHAYYPFGGGPRACIGQGLTMLEAVLLLATIGQRFQLRPLPGQNLVPYPGPSFSLRPQHGLQVQILAR
ncbi:cytochrome P450 [Nodosilinea sp. LEGE 07298]|uniref:cytochrome P450 n=1 Tax=Nodosilinea sp. LEGE 07298 TaxID=2777970 RepID=UPI00187E17C6|nr:cytochrome P450 [Nodosilinea sp. LEGE 07298]MBE9112021.1 cytochrome P450 [Nodosilinea sp. LEGE 07298]